MKTAISLPDELYSAVDAYARKLKLSRSSLLAQAAREFVAKHREPIDATKAWNLAIEKGGQPGDEPGIAALRQRSKKRVGRG